MTELRRDGTKLRPVCRGNSYGYPWADRRLPGDSGDTLLALMKLCEEGELSRKIFDRVHQCPRCLAGPVNFRECCPQCHSLDFSPTEMLHHFPCGYVGDSTEFQHGDAADLICPKCAKPLRHIGMDYEKPVSAEKCNACGLRFRIAAVRCRCLVCEFEFDPADASIQTVYEFEPAEPQRLRAPAPVRPDTELPPFTVSMEMFRFLLHQNFCISRELGYDIHIITATTAGMNDSEVRDLVRLMHEFKRPSDVICLSDAGVLLVLVFYLRAPELERLMAEFRLRYAERSASGGKKAVFRIHRFLCRQEDEIGRVLENIRDAALEEEQHETLR